MAITNKEEGVWGLDQAFAKQNQGSIWNYTWGASLYMCGYGDDGANGQNNVVSYSSPTQVPGVWSTVSVACNDRIVAATKQDGTLWTWGKDYAGSAGWNTDGDRRSSPVQVTGFPPATVDTGKIHEGGLARCSILSTSYVDEEGTLWTWGRNEVGQLGHNDKAHRSMPTQVGAKGEWSQNLAVNDDECRMIVNTGGKLWGWGSGGNGQLATNNTVSYSSPIQISNNNWPTEIGTISRGQQSSAGIDNDGKLWVWGENYAGALGLNEGEIKRSSPIQLGNGTDWRYIGNADQTFLATKTDGTLWTWGNNQRGCVGDNTVISRSSPIQVPGTNWYRPVDCKRQASACTKTDGTLWVWGRNDKGSLGLNDIIGRSSPVQMGSNTGWNNVPARSAASMGGSVVGSGAYLYEG